MAETFDAPPPQSAPHQPPPHQAAARPAPQPPPYQPEARQPEPPPRAAQPATEPVPPPMTEPARPAAGPTPSEKLLAEQVEYLRLQLDRRDKTIVEKDALIADLMQTLARLGRTAIKRIHTPGVVGEDLQDEFDRNRRQQSEINERHERVLHNISDVLASVRNHLARQRPPGGSDD